MEKARRERRERREEREGERKGNERKMCKKKSSSLCKMMTQNQKVLLFEDDVGVGVVDEGQGLGGGGGVQEQEIVAFSSRAE